MNESTHSCVLLPTGPLLYRFLSRFRHHLTVTPINLSGNGNSFHSSRRWWQRLLPVSRLSLSLHLSSIWLSRCRALSLVWNAALVALNARRWWFSHACSPMNRLAGVDRVAVACVVERVAAGISLALGFEWGCPTKEGDEIWVLLPSRELNTQVPRFDKLAPQHIVFNKPSPNIYTLAPKNKKVYHFSHNSTRYKLLALYYYSHMFILLIIKYLCIDIII